MMGVTCYNSDGTPLNYLTQWDKNITLVLKGIETSFNPVIHFSNRLSKKAIIVSPTVGDDFISAEIPNVLLEYKLPVTVRVYYTYEDGSSRTKYTKFINVVPKAKPDNYGSVDSGGSGYGGGYVAQGDPPNDTSVLWIDTDDNGAGGHVDGNILKSPDGTAWSITISNDGIIAATKLESR